MAQQKQPKRPRRPVQPEGDYLATINSAEDTIAKSSGNRMWVVEYVIHGPTQVTTVKDYLVKTKDNWRPKALAKALGVEPEGFDPRQHLKARLMVTLSIEASEQYGPSNKVQRYFAPEDQAAPAWQPAAVDEDEIPF